MTEILRGTFTVLLTPFTTDGAVDFEALDRLIEDQIGAGVEGLVILGTTSESPTIDAEEKRAILGFAVERSAGRTRIIAGVGTNDTASSVAQAEAADAQGANALLVGSPYYNKPTQAGLDTHFRRIADAVPLPQIVYNIKGRSGVNIETETLCRLAEHPNIVGVKEASDDIDQIMDVIAAVADDFAVLAGSDHLNVPVALLGGAGAISALANLVPAEVKASVDAALAGDLATARALHYRLLPLARGCFLETNPIPVKTALALQGRLQEVFREPLVPMRPATRAALVDLLEAHGLIDERAAAAAG